MYYSKNAQRLEVVINSTQMQLDSLKYDWKLVKAFARAVKKGLFYFERMLLLPKVIDGCRLPNANEMHWFYEQATHYLQKDMVKL